MTRIKTALIAATAVAAFVGATLVAVGSAKAEVYVGDRYNSRIDRAYEDRRDHTADRYSGERHHPVLRRVHAVGHASGGPYVPYPAKYWRARRDAIENWTDKVARTYGPQVARWWSARDKQVNCDDRYDSVRCHVSAIPSRTYWGWNE
jgi:hypothetical protein